jgi:hypothetical protein
MNLMTERADIPCIVACILDQSLILTLVAIVLALGGLPGGTVAPCVLNSTLGVVHVFQANYFDQREQGPRRTHICLATWGHHDYNI